ncbi:MAG: peptidoglycan DD-metalloendopeptidase family protein [Alphaproteobacteria bacterium]|nr:peptidoglycan DD-metalloendopeptidase family protein [Alphaproteobacteria bacterium]
MNFDFGKHNSGYHINYAEKKKLFSDKEIIFRSRGCAKVWNITSKMQMGMLCVALLVAVGSFYSYYLYNRTGNILSSRDRELLQTRHAYLELMGDFVNLHNNVNNMISNLEKQKSQTPELNKYKQQAEVLEDKIKQITAQTDWLTDEKVSQQISLNEALLQRDIAASERDELKEHLREMYSAVDDIRSAETEVFDRIKVLANKEVQKIKSAFAEINVPIRRAGLYFNALANSKKDGGKGGPFMPDMKVELKDKILSKKIAEIYKTVEDVEYYREVMHYVPIGKPVWSYWVTSHFGTRSDPFKAKKATHKGIDLASRTGNKIKTQAKGKITRAEVAGGYGNLVEINHGNGFVTKYAHLHKIYVKKGDYVEYNQAIGEVGNTGRSTGPHLHYEILYQGRPVNPMPFLKAKKS